MIFSVFTPKGAVKSDFDIFLSKIESSINKSEEPFTQERIKILNNLSKKFFHSPLASEFPQIVVLGFWLRNSSIKKYTNDFISKTPDHCVPYAKGLAFHLPPQNVDTMFVYSWAISFLMGNSNIVRLPSKLNSLSEWIIIKIVEVLKKANEHNRNLFCSYPIDSIFTNRLSLICDLRIIWGGDEKIDSVSKSPLKPTGSNINFPDRQSLCIIDSEVYESSDDATKQTLAENLYNDIFWFDQMVMDLQKQ